MLPVPASSRRRHRSHGSYAAFLSRFSGHHGARVGQVVWPYVSVADIDDLDASMRQLNTDVMDLSPGPVPDVNTSAWAEWRLRDAAIRKWRWDWVSFYQAWVQWRDDHYGEWSRLGEEPRQQFDNWVAGYNERLRSFREEFGQGETGAQKKTPAGTAAGGTLDQIGDLLKLAIVAGIGYIAYKELRKK